MEAKANNAPWRVTQCTTYASLCDVRDSSNAVLAERLPLKFALLIAAAPDLYDALTDAIAKHKELLRHCLTGAPLNTTDDACVDRWCAALRKAESHG